MGASLEGDLRPQELETVEENYDLMEPKNQHEPKSLFKK